MPGIRSRLAADGSNLKNFVNPGIVAGTVLGTEGGGEAVRKFEIGAAGLQYSLEEDLRQAVWKYPHTVVYISSGS
jgi:hypothetical protein